MSDERPVAPVEGLQPVEAMAESLLLDPDRRPWEQHNGESDLAFSRFRAYLETVRGRRSYKELAAQQGVSSWTIAHTARMNHWHERVVAWDAYVDAFEEQEFLDERRRIGRDAARVMSGAVGTAQVALQASALTLGAYARSDGTRRLNPRDALTALGTASRVAKDVHAVVAEQPASRVEISGPGGQALAAEGLGVGLSMIDLAELMVRLAASGPAAAAAVVEPVVEVAGLEAGAHLAEGYGNLDDGL